MPVERKLTHEIRRAVAFTMLLNGTPIHVVKEILGHSTIKTTELYAFTNEEAKEEAAKERIDLTQRRRIPVGPSAKAHLYAVLPWQKGDRSPAAITRSAAPEGV